MEASDRAQLEILQREQKRLLQRLEQVGLRLVEEENRVRLTVRTLERLKAAQSSLQAETITLADRILALESVLGESNAQQEPPPLPDVPAPPLLPEIMPSSLSSPSALPEAPLPESAHLSVQEQPAEPVSHEPVKDRGSFEMRLGTYWLVRIGIVMLLSGMVFLGNYAYQNFVGKLGPAGKVTLLYVGSGLLLGLGSWFGRKQEKLKNYAQVLFAGGLAAVYFTTYAAHHVPALRVIVSPVTDGFLLLGWAGFMVWVATREKSETLALFAIGLGYYTSIITHVGLFTLYSNVVLTAAAVFFLLRNRWATLTFGSLAATYAAYAFWRFNDGGTWRWASPEEGLWTGVYFLFCYWVIFTAAVFLSRHEHFSGRKRTTFLTLNNGAFFALFLLTMLQVRQGGFWKFALGYGAVLLGLAVAASRWLKQDRLSANAYLTQGLLLVTLGFISYYTGLKLGLVLAVESVTLFVLSHLLRSRVMFGGSLGAGVFATLRTIFSMNESDPTDLYLGCGVAALLLVNTLVKQAREWPSTKADQIARALFAVAGSLVILKTSWSFCPPEYCAALLASEGLLLTFSVYLFRSRELALAGQGFVALAQMLCLSYLAEQVVLPSSTPACPWWNPVLVGMVTLGLSHWWQKQQRLKVPAFFSQFLELLYALALTGLIYYGLKRQVSAAAWPMVLTFLALGITAYGAATRAWFLAGAAQLFIMGSAVAVLRQMWFGLPAHPMLCLLPLAGFLLLAWFGARILVAKGKAPEGTRQGIRVLSVFYLWAAFALSLAWIFEFVSPRERFWVLSLLGTLLFVAGGKTGRNNVAVFGFSYTGLAFFYLWGRFGSETIVYLPNFLGVLLLFVQQQLARRKPQLFPVPASFHSLSIALGSLSLWLLLSKFVLTYAGGFYLTVAWGFLALALFAAGFLLSERMHRWAGLALLGLALGRVVLFDVWKLETIYRIFSFLALGMVLLVLGFIYNKYQDKIRQWL